MFQIQSKNNFLIEAFRNVWYNLALHLRLKIYKLSNLIKKFAIDWYFCILNMYIIIRDEAKQDFLKSYYLKFYLYFTLLKLINILTLNTLLHNIKTTCVVQTEVQQGIWSLNCGN